MSRVTTQTEPAGRKEGREQEQRRELADFVRAQRERLKPEVLGLPAGTRRRTPGLRREEVAQLCGLSVTWYTWLEQGREVSLSPAALSRLAKALRLGRAERAYLFELTGRRDPEPETAAFEPVPPAALACLETIRTPAYLLDRAWTARGWNRAAQQLFVGWLDGPGERNLLRYIFLEPRARALIHGYEERARRVVAEFRAGASRHLDEPPIRSLVEDLRRRSAAFAQLWTEHSVLDREGGLRSFEHPEDGLLHYEQVSFDLAGRPDLKLTMLVERAPGVEG